MMLTLLLILIVLILLSGRTVSWNMNDPIGLIIAVVLVVILVSLLLSFTPFPRYYW